MSRVITSSNSFAIYFMREAIRKNCVMNVTKLQKMAFACYGYYLANSTDRLFDEHPEAWKYGPVFPSLRANYNYIYQQALLSLYDEEPKWADSLVKEVVGFVLYHVGNWTANSLVAWSHAKGSPWSVTTNNGDIEYIGMIIPDSIIKEYFSDGK